VSSLARLTTFLVVLGGVLMAGGSLLWYLTYGIERDPPERQTLDAVADSVRIGWGPEDVVTIRATTLDDALAALGFVHGRNRAWSVALWRQAALGRLGEWFGAPALELDRLTRHLGLATLAQRGYADLGDEDRAALDAYAAGLNAAWRSPDVHLQQEFVLFDLALEPWRPWHTLALERLFAWLATQPPTPDELTEAGTDVMLFYEADRSLRAWLHLHGFENSIAWAVRDSSGTHFFQRHVYGATALSFLQEVGLALPDGSTFWGASLPGTPFFPTGKSEKASWALLLTSTAHLERIPWHPETATTEYQRILINDGTEHLTSYRRMEDRLPFPPSTTDAAVDTVWSIRWPGLLPHTDSHAWHRLLAGESAPFHLVDGSGLWVDRDGTWRVLGTPPALESFPTGVFVGTSPWSRYAAEFLRTQATGSVQLASWIDDAYSIWAAQTAPPLANSTGPLALNSLALRDAVTYLRNWDYTYDRASIAASIFDRWMRTYLETTGTLPVAAALDSSAATQAVLHQTLAKAVQDLTETFGQDQRQWRWEHVQPDRRYFPIWSVEALRTQRAGPGIQARFAAVTWPGHGHPSALAWGPAAAQRTLPAPAMWESWLSTAAWSTLTVRRQHLDPHTPLGRYLTSDRRAHPLALPPSAAPAFETVLLPPPL